MNKTHSAQNVKLPADDTPVWQLTVGQLRAVLGTPAVDDDHPRTADEIRKLHPDVTDTWLSSHVVAAGRGPKQRRMYRPSAVRDALSASPVQPRRPKKCASTEGDPFESMLRDGTLVRGAK